MDGIEKFNETQLPPKEAFYSKLYKSDICDEEKRFAKNLKLKQ